MTAMTAMLSTLLLLLAGTLAVASGLAARLRPPVPDERPAADPAARHAERLSAFYLAARGAVGGVFLVHGVTRLLGAALDGLMTGRLLGAAPLTMGLNLVGLLVLSVVGALFLRDLLAVALRSGATADAGRPSPLLLPLGLAGLAIGLLLLAVASLEVIV